MTTSEPGTEFDWLIYADATFAGLSVLIPVPVLDLIFERFFRRRMVAAIARRRGRSLPPPVRSELVAGAGDWRSSCLALPLTATLWLAKRTSRKILYFLTIKDAADQLSYYWQRAYLVDHMLKLDQLENEASAVVARQAMEHVLDTSTTPLEGLARQVIAGTRHVLRTLVSARRGKQDDVIRQVELRMSHAWAGFAGYLHALGARYEQTYRQMQAGPVNPS